MRTCGTLHELVEVVDTLGLVNDGVNVQEERTSVLAGRGHVLLDTTLRYVVYGSLRHTFVSFYNQLNVNFNKNTMIM